MEFKIFVFSIGQAIVIGNLHKQPESQQSISQPECAIHLSKILLVGTSGSEIGIGARVAAAGAGVGAEIAVKGEGIGKRESQQEQKDRSKRIHSLN